MINHERFIRHLKPPCVLFSIEDPTKSNPENWYNDQKFLEHINRIGVPFKKVARYEFGREVTYYLLKATSRELLPSLAVIAQEFGELYNQEMFLVIDKKRRVFKHYIFNDEVEDMGYLQDAPANIAKERDEYFFDAVTEQYFVTDNVGTLLGRSNYAKLWGL